MRRLIAYITTAIAMLLAIGVAATPVITKLNNGREFTSSRDYREIVFKIAEGDNEEENKERASLVAEQMRERLNNYNVEDYSIKIQGEDTVAVALDMDSKNFNYCAKYLTFSGESFALVSSNGTSVRNEHKLFNADDVKIEYKGDANIPVVIIPVTEEGKQDIKDLCGEFKTEDGDNNAKSIIRRGAMEVSAEGEEEEQKPSNYLYLWANFDEAKGESLESLNKDPIAREKVLMAFNPESIWYEDSKEAETEIFYMCATAEQDNPNQLDISGLKDDNARANYLVGLLKASAYKFEVSCPTIEISESAMTVDYFANARVLSASAESLLVLGNNVNIKVAAKTFIALAIAVVIVSLLLIVYYRLSALAIIATTLGTTFITLVSFVSMHVLFNVPAVIGFIILTAGVLFGEIAYVNRFKEEVYKGRTIKKANQEASKKTNLITIDSGIILAFSGLMMYALGGTALKPLGVVLFFGAVFTLLMNLLVFKLLMFLVTNSTNLQQKYNVFNIDGEKVPNIMSVEEKPSYEAPYEKVDFTKRKGIVSIIFGALSAAALACIVVFGVTSSTKSPLNVEKAVSDTTVIYTSVKVEGETSLISDASTFVEYVLKDTDEFIKIKNAEDQVDVKKVSQYVYEDEEHQRTDNYYYFTLNVNEKLSDDKRSGLEEKLNDNLVAQGLSTDELTYAVVRNSQELIYTPSQGYVALATGISIVGIALYFAFRFRPSRGIAVLVTTTGATTIAYGAMVAMRFIGTTAVTSLAMPIVAVTMMLASLFYLSTEKTMLKEGKFELTPEVRKETMVKAIGKSASAMFAFMLINLYIVINFFGFGVENTALLFASAMIGEVVAVIALLCVAGPLANGVEKLFSKIHLPKIKWFSKDNKPKQVTRRNSSEPEETIFIGIND